MVKRYPNPTGVIKSQATARKGTHVKVVHRITEPPTVRNGCKKGNQNTIHAAARKAVQPRQRAGKCARVARGNAAVRGVWAGGITGSGGNVRYGECCWGSFVFAIAVQWWGYWAGRQRHLSEYTFQHTSSKRTHVTTTPPAAAQPHNNAGYNGVVGRIFHYPQAGPVGERRLIPGRWLTWQTGTEQYNTVSTVRSRTGSAQHRYRRFTTQRSGL